MLDFEPEFNVGLWTQFSLIKGSNLILELEPDDPIGQFNNVFWTSANDSISLSKKLTCWVLKGPTGQSSPGKATESRGVGVGVGGIIIYCFRFNMNHVIHPIETPECYIWTTWFNMWCGSLSHLPSGVTPLVRDPLVKDSFLLPIWNHLWFYKIKLYAKREEIT